MGYICLYCLYGHLSIRLLLVYQYITKSRRKRVEYSIGKQSRVIVAARSVPIRKKKLDESCVTFIVMLMSDSMCCTLYNNRTIL